MEVLSNVFQCAMHEIREGIPNPALQLRGHWGEEYFHNTNPIVLELGCGHGEYTVGLAKAHHDCNYIGIDIKGARMWHGAKQAYEAQMSNVAFLRINIEEINHFFCSDEIAEIWITFPDPQMKKATKRLTSTFFMKRYKELLRPSGLIHLKTDSPFLYAYTKEMIKVNRYTLLHDTDDLYHSNLAVEDSALVRIQTHYEKQWLDRGLTIKYLNWQLPDLPDFIEPEIEIEKDNYRSYGRSYVTTNTQL